MANRTWPALEVQRADSEIGDLIQAFLLDFGVAAIDNESLPGISRVFFHDDDGRDRAAGGLRAQFPAVDVRAIDVPDEDWAARSQASLRAIHVGRIIVAIAVGAAVAFAGPWAWAKIWPKLRRYRPAIEWIIALAALLVPVLAFYFFPERAFHLVHELVAAEESQPRDLV